MSGTEQEIPPSTKTIDLRPPIKFRGASYDQLILREPSVGEKRKAEGQMRSNISNEGLTLYKMHLLQMITGWPLPAVELIPVSVFDEAWNFIEGFLSAGQETTLT